VNGDRPPIADAPQPASITETEAQYALGIVRRICDEVGPGLPGSPQERARAEIIRQELESHLGPENVSLEDFRLAPDAFLAAPAISTVWMVLAALLNLAAGRLPGIPVWVSASAAVGLSIVAVLIFLLGFVLALEVLDPLFPKRTSVNVIGRLRKPSAGPIRRLLLFSGHHDSAVEFNWIRFTRYGYFILSITWMFGLITVLGMSAIQWMGAVSGEAALARFGTLGWRWLVYPLAPSIAYVLFFAGSRRDGGQVPGAADNLASCATAVALARFLVENPSALPEETEIRFVCFGSEEAGVRGSRRYVERHIDELRRLDARLVNFETIVHPVVTILSSETNGAVRNSPAMVASLVAAAEGAGVPYRVQPAILGTSSDAGPFSKAGLKATTLIPWKFPQQTVAFYHTRRDRPDILTVEPLLNVLRLSLAWIRSGGEGPTRDFDEDA
jgi:hypothetical protein